MTIGLGLQLGLGLSRPGAWTPAELGPSLLAWWDASSGVTITGAGVSSWVDRKAGLDMQQGTDAARPPFSATGFGGAPCLTFDGVDDCLTLATQPFPADAEIWAVLGQTALAADTTSRCAFAFGNGSGSGARRLWRFVVSGVNRARQIAGDGVGSTTAADTTVDLSSRHLVVGRAAGGNVTCSVDQAAEVVVAGGSAPGATRCRIGATDQVAPGAFWQGPIAQLWLTAPLTAAQRAMSLQNGLSRRML